MGFGRRRQGRECRNEKDNGQYQILFVVEGLGLRTVGGLSNYPYYGSIFLA